MFACTWCHTLVSLQVTVPMVGLPHISLQSQILLHVDTEQVCRIGPVGFPPLQTPTTMPRRFNREKNTVRFKNRDLQILERMKIKQRRYFIIKKLSSGRRKRFLAFDPDAGPDGDFRVMLRLEHAPSAQRHLRSLMARSRKNQHLPPIIDFQSRQGEVLVVLNWIQGQDLQEFLELVSHGKKQQPSPAHAIRLVSRLAHGLTSLHRRPGLIHGDIRPANLVLTFDPSRLVAIDYGSAWMAPQTNRQIDGDGIDPCYSAPELQTPGHDIDSRCDQFSLTAVLYKLLTLQAPYDGLGGQAGLPTFIAQTRNSFVRPSKLCSHRERLPTSQWDDIDQVVERGLALSPEDRYSTSDAWLSELQHVYGRLHFENRLSPTNERLTRVMSWINRQLRGNRPR